MYSAFGFTVNWATPTRAPAPSMTSLGSVYQPPHAFHPIGAASAGTAASTMAPPRIACASRRGNAKRGMPECEDFVMVYLPVVRHARPGDPALAPAATDLVRLAPTPGM